MASEQIFTKGPVNIIDSVILSTRVNFGTIHFNA